VSGSEDRKLTLWDLGKIERTTILSGAELENEKPSYRYVPAGTVFIEI
jgi:phosphoinositide-3-kinase regulatory subunit 4